MARVCRSLAAYQRHTPSSLAAVIGLSNNDVMSFRYVIPYVPYVACVALDGNPAWLMMQCWIELVNSAGSRISSSTDCDFYPGPVLSLHWKKDTPKLKKITRSLSVVFRQGAESRMDIIVSVPFVGWTTANPNNGSRHVELTVISLRLSSRDWLASDEVLYMARLSWPGT